MNELDLNSVPAASSDDSQQRLINMQALKAAGYKPFGASFPVTASLGEIRAAFQEGLTVRAAGRIMAIRDMGKSLFADLRSGNERFELFVGKS